MRAEPIQETNHHLVEHVVAYIRDGLEDRSFAPGDRLLPERDLARQLRLSRATVRSAIGYLAAMGVLRIRRGVGTFIADGPPEIGKSSLGMMGALHGFQPWQMFEARIILESSLAELAAERGSDADLTALAEEVAEMYASCDNPAEYLIHDVRFHRTIARASGNPILAGLMETVAAALYDDRRKTVENTRRLRESAEIHRAIFRAIRSGDGSRARELMGQHLKRAEVAQVEENESTRVAVLAPPPIDETALPVEHVPCALPASRT